MNNLSIGANNHIPSYVSVYNSLYSDIMDGVYEENEFLPSETSLAEKYGVSRNTLRQALAILNEDGLILKSQGKGTIVTKRNDKKILNKIFNPMVNLSINSIDNIEIQYNFNPPTDIARKELNLDKSSVILASNNIYSVGEKVVGFSFVQIPLNKFSNLGIDISSKDEINKLINNTIFDVATNMQMNIKLVLANEMEVSFLNVLENTPLILNEAILFDKSNEPLARCKFYFIPEHYKLQFQI